MTELTSAAPPGTPGEAPIYDRLISIWPRQSTVDHITEVLTTRDRARAEGWDYDGPRPQLLQVLGDPPPVATAEPEFLPVHTRLPAHPADGGIGDGDMTELLSQSLDTGLPDEDKPQPRKRSRKRGSDQGQ